MKNLLSSKPVTLTLFCLFALNVCIGKPKAEQINKLMAFCYESGQFNGSLLVVEHGKVIYEKGFGLANMEWGIPNRSNTKFRIGSITKQFTAMLVLQLVEQGKIKLDEPIQTYLPDYPSPTGEKITIHQLLSHSSGIKDYTSLPGFRNGGSQGPVTPDDLIKMFAGLPLGFDPGEKFAYSNSGYIVLGKIIEKVSGQSYAQCLQDNIFAPLKMVNSGYDNNSVLLRNRASGYQKSGGHYVNASHIDMDAAYAAGALYSTVKDLLLWDRALYSDQLLSPQSMALLFANQIPIHKNASYGYGWYVGDVPNLTKHALRVVQHGGNLPGFVTRISRMPEDRNLIVLLNNTGVAPLGEISDAIRAILYGKPFTLPKISFAKTILEVMTNQGLARGIEKMNELKSSIYYDVQEADMNEAGYYLLRAGKIEEALEILKFNAEKFPRSGNVYDSLGEAYLKAGHKEQAILNYKKAIALDPDNKNAIKALEEISRQ